MSTPPARDGALTAAELDRLEALGEAAIPELVDALDTPKWVLRRRVVRLLGDLGDHAVRPLCDVLRHRRDDEGRIAAAVDALALAVRDDDRPVVALTESDDPAVVADGVMVLGRARSAGAVPALVGLVRHADDNVALAAIEALGRVGSRAAIDPLVETVQSGNFFRAFPAIDVLGRTRDPRAVPPLVDLLDQAPYALEAIRSLGRTGDRGAVRPLVTRLQSASASLTRVIAAALADLERAYAERFGEGEPVRAEVRAAATDALVLRVGRALHGADEVEAAAVARLLGAFGRPSAEPYLLSLIDQGSAASEAAAAALEGVQREHQHSLRQAVAQGGSERRRVLLPHLTASRDAIEAVSSCLTDLEPEVRALACDVLARIGDPSVVPRLFDLLRDPSVRVSQAATAAIQSLGSDQTEQLTLEALGSSSVRLRRAALRIAGYFGYRSAFPAVAEAAALPDPRLRDGAIQALPFLDHPDGRRVLLERAEAADAHDRASAIRALGHVRRDPRVVEVLRRAVADPDAWVRYYAAQALARQAPADAADSLAPLLQDAAPQVRLGAIDALAMVQGDVAFQLLAGIARSADPESRRAALVGIGLSRRPAARELLLEAMRVDDPATRLVAASALTGHDEPGSVEALVEATRDPEPTVATAALAVLGGMRSLVATSALVDLLRQRPDDPRVLDALARWSPGRGQGLLVALEKADDDLAPLLTGALARMRRPEAEEVLVRALSLDNVAARKAAATVLAERASPEAHAAVMAAATADPSEEVRQICALALGRR